MNPSQDKQSPVKLEPSVDHVVAANLARIRKRRGMSRPALASKLSGITGTKWSQWRIIDLEGARAGDRPPRSAKWSELVALAIGLDTTIFELVLPPENERLVNISTSSFVLPTPGEDQPDAVWEHRYNMEPSEFCEMLFRLPLRMLSQENLELAAQNLEYVPAVWRIEGTNLGITDTIDEASQLLEKLMSIDGPRLELMAKVLSLRQRAKTIDDNTGVEELVEIKNQAAEALTRIEQLEEA